MHKPKFDVIIPVTGGLKKNGKPHDWTIGRLDKVLEIHTGKEMILIPGRGTPFKPPPLSKEKFPVDECVASADYLVKHGISPRKILLERTSFDTIGNAYFTRVLFAEPMNFHRLLVITSDFHMPRVMAIFNWVYGLKPVFSGLAIEFLSISDKGLNEELIRVKTRREKINLKNLKSLLGKIKTIREMRRFMFSRHYSYAYGRKIEKLRGKILKTY